jgi:thymidylate synthase
MKTHGSFSNAMVAIGTAMEHLSYPVHSDRWQGVDISKKPEMQMYELLNYSFQTPLSGYVKLEQLQAEIKPNLPWADEHFEKERMSGHPINPGETWKTWPWGNSADKFRDANGGQFNHSYAERYWPKYAGKTGGGVVSDEFKQQWPMAHHGIRYEYADVNDLVNHLVEDPLSRQAYMPVWFPEDGSHNDRKPCSIGYHFILRNGYFHVVYQLRSCDFYRHFRDDVYLTVRLHRWIFDEIRKRCDAKSMWKKASYGMYVMHITSLHVFKNDFRALFQHEHASEASKKA